MTTPFLSPLLLLAYLAVCAVGVFALRVSWVLGDAIKWALMGGRTKAAVPAQDEATLPDANDAPKDAPV